MGFFPELFIIRINVAEFFVGRFCNLKIVRKSELAINCWYFWKFQCDQFLRCTKNSTVVTIASVDKIVRKLCLEHILSKKIVDTFSRYSGFLTSSQVFFQQFLLQLISNWVTKIRISIFLPRRVEL
eukprot:TRINITY_DN3518_c1_g1_i1.p7 TRINITY_DN3518_c1_g1~~TRINITY_DN3518_c1_g1_i1.p7  ORF type:complete len:126 (-),score=6.79 TRINITY_DN3518_c1_g1_i1:1134-1511(-)